MSLKLIKNEKNFITEQEQLNNLLDYFDDLNVEENIEMGTITELLIGNVFELYALRYEELIYKDKVKENLNIPFVKHLKRKTLQNKKVLRGDVFGITSNKNRVLGQEKAKEFCFEILKAYNLIKKDFKFSVPLYDKIYEYYNTYLEYIMNNHLENTLEDFEIRDENIDLNTLVFFSSTENVEGINPIYLLFFMNIINNLEYFSTEMLEEEITLNFGEEYLDIIEVYVEDDVNTETAKMLSKSPNLFY